jgi:hypothetical protein
VYQSEPFVWQAPENCNQFKKALRIKLTINLTTSNNQGPPTSEYYYVNSESDYSLFGITNSQLTINWGDGTAPQVINNYFGTNVEHIYASEGSYYPTTTYKFVRAGQLITLYDGNNQGSSNTSIAYHINGVCGNTDISKYQTFESGIWKMNCKIWINNNFLGSFVGSYTHSWKYANGAWRRKIANIYTNVTGKFRTDACALGEN